LAENNHHTDASYAELVSASHLVWIAFILCVYVFNRINRKGRKVFTQRTQRL